MEELYLEHVQTILVSLPFALFFLWIAKINGYFSYPVKEELPQPKLPFKYLLAAFGIFLVSQLLVIPLIAIAIIAILSGQGFDVQVVDLDQTTRGWLNLFALVGTCLAVVGYFFALPKLIRQQVFGYQTYVGLWNGIRGGLLGALSWVISYPVVVVLTQIIAIGLLFFFEAPKVDQSVVSQLKTTMENPIQFAVTAVMIITLVPFVEELMFRGFLQTWLRQYMDRSWAIGVASLIFAGFHYAGSQGIRNIEILSALFVLSLFLGFLYERQKTLWAPIGLHMTFNAVSIVMILQP